jgi:formate--tetrahydrofolate ligase
VTIIVTLNAFTSDTENEYNFIKTFCGSKGCEFELSKVWEKGGNRGTALGFGNLSVCIAKTESSLII